MTVTIYDWPSAIVPSGQMFYASGQSVDGGFTTSGTLISAREPGGRASLDATFSFIGGQSGRVSARLVSWLLSKVGNGTVFRFPIARTPQLVSATDLGIDASYDDSGIPWDNDQPWDSGENWLFEPVVTATAGALEGTTEVVVYVATLGEAIQYGHLIGHNDRAYHVEAIEYEGTIATITVSPPVREDIEIGDLLTLRPKLLATVADPAAFRSMFQVGGVIQPGSLTLIEALP